MTGKVVLWCFFSCEKIHNSTFQVKIRDLYPQKNVPVKCFKICYISCIRKSHVVFFLILCNCTYYFFPNEYPGLCRWYDFEAIYLNIWLSASLLFLKSDTCNTVQHTLEIKLIHTNIDTWISCYMQRVEYYLGTYIQIDFVVKPHCMIILNCLLVLGVFFFFLKRYLSCIPMQWFFF